MIFTLSGRQTKDVLKNSLIYLKEKYLIENDVMDTEGRIELLENIVDLEIIINKME